MKTPKEFKGKVELLVRNNFGCWHQTDAKTVNDAIRFARDWAYNNNSYPDTEARASVSLGGEAAYHATCRGKRTLCVRWE